MAREFSRHRGEDCAASRGKARAGATSSHSCECESECEYSAVLLSPPVKFYSSCKTLKGIVYDKGVAQGQTQTRQWQRQRQPCPAGSSAPGRKRCQIKAHLNARRLAPSSQFTAHSSQLVALVGHETFVGVINATQGASSKTSEATHTTL